MCLHLFASKGKGCQLSGTFLTGEKRPRDDSRGPSDRERTAAREHDRGGEGSRTQRVDQEKDREAVSQTIIIKGLSAHTTEPAVNTRTTARR